MEHSSYRSEGDAARWVSPEELYEQYRQAVAVVAGDLEAQLAWMHTGEIHVGPDEIMLSLDDAVSVFQARLVRTNLLDPEAVEAVAKVLAEFNSWQDVTLWQSEEAMTRPEWVHIRSTAAAALAIMTGHASKA